METRRNFIIKSAILCAVLSWPLSAATARAAAREF